MSRSSATEERIAIVGIGCRFPGGADSAEAYWNLLVTGADGITEIPPDRWNVERFYNPDPEARGKMYVRAGGFLRERIDGFDAAFFGISPREAEYLDPQQRLLLEVAWEALEDAGLPPEGLAASQTGVYIGGFMLDSLVSQMSPLGRDRIGQHTAAGSTMSILSNRLSYVFDFRGPSLSIDTACSSSLVAFHQACQALRRGECSLALVGGVNLMHRPETPIAMCKGGFLARDGRCKSFDARADGYGRGEGAGIVVLKPYADALRDGDRVYALVRGTGVNQDGRTDGMTVPSREAQETLIRTVCASAGVAPRRIGYVEAHGTGTPVGDPIESAALGAVIGAGRTPGEGCWVGSVKANIGHLEAASGVAGVIKTALILQRGQIPPLANLQQPNPAIPFDELGLRLPRRVEPLPSSDEPALAAVNSFGYGGTNAHALLEAAPPVERLDVAEAGPYCLPLSARSAPALVELASAYAALLEGGASAHDVSYSAACKRGHQRQRLAAVGDSREELAAQLRNFAGEGRGTGVFTGSAVPSVRGPVFVFTGMGPQWWGMGRELLQHEPVFRELAQRASAIFERLAGWSILDEMTIARERSRAQETQIAQPANFIVQAGLAALWRSWGVEPAAVVGHSVGEIASAYAAGVLDLESAVAVAYHRSRIQKRAAGLGTMLATGLGESDARGLAAEYGGRVSLAACNSATAVTLAGDADSLNEIALRLAERDVFQRFLQVEVAYHSPYMDPLQADLRDALGGLKPCAAERPLYSTVSGELAEPGDYAAAYWCRNIREPVYFARAMASLIRDGHRTFLEIGPHPVLSASIRQCLGEHAQAGTSLASLRREQPERRMLAEALAGLYAAGCPIDWRVRHSGGGVAIRLPSYPWQRERYWRESSAARADRLAPVEHALLGRPLEGPSRAWESELAATHLPYLSDHVVDDLVVLPGAAYVEVGLALHRRLGNPGAPAVLKNLELHQALVVERHAAPLLHVAYDEAGREFVVHSRTGDDAKQDWTLHARGALSWLPPAPAEPLDLVALRARCSESLDAAQHYAEMDARGLHYGPWFRGVLAVSRNPATGESVAEIRAPLAQAHEDVLHPALLDACFQALLAVRPLHEDAELYVPVRIRELRLHARPTGPVWCHCRQTRSGVGSVEGDLVIADAEGRVLVELRGIQARALSAKQRDPLADLERWLYEFEWVEAARESSAPRTGAWLILGGSDGSGEALAAQLAARGVESILHAQGEGLELRARLEAGDAQRVAGIVHLGGLEQPVQDDPTGIAKLSALLELVQTLVDQSEAPELVVVTRGAQSRGAGDAPLALDQAPLVGLLRVVFNEHAELACRTIDIDRDPATLEPLAGEILEGRREEEVLLRGALRCVHRLVRAPLPRGERGAAGGTADRIRVRAALRSGGADAPRWTAVGVLEHAAAERPDLQAGDLVLALLDEAPGDTAHATPERVLALPAGVAACLPGHEAQLLELALAYHGLHGIAQLAAGESLLIHDAATPLGLAALEIARWRGARVFAAVADDAERAFLADRDIEAICDATSSRFCDEIRARTGERGLDVVLSSRPGELVAASAELLAPFGRLVHISSEPLDARPVRANRSLAVLDPAAWLRARPDHLRAVLGELAERIREGALRPFAVRAAEEPVEWTCTPASATRPHGQLDPDGSYLVTGGFGGFGLEVAAWLVASGARHVALVGRRGASTPDGRAAVERLERAGARVLAIAADIGCEADVERVLHAIERELPPLRGVFHSAAVLDDGPIRSLDRGRLATVMGPKAVGAWLLHQHTRERELDQFVLFSSIASQIGSPGQASYVAANVFLDALALERRLHGLPGTSLNWGALGEVGMAARHAEVSEYFRRVGIGSFSPGQALEVLGRVLRWNPVGLGAAIMDWRAWGQFNPAWAASPRYAAIAEAALQTADGASGGTAWLRELPLEERASRVAALVGELVARTLRLDAGAIDPTQSLLNLGVDSLMAMELQTAIDDTLGVKLSTLELMKGNNLLQLAARIAQGLEGGPAAPAEVAAPAGDTAAATNADGLPADPVELLFELDSLSDEQLDDLLARIVPQEESAR